MIFYDLNEPHEKFTEESWVIPSTVLVDWNTNMPVVLIDVFFVIWVDHYGMGVKIFEPDFAQILYWWHWYFDLREFRVLEMLFVQNAIEMDIVVF